MITANARLSTELRCSELWKLDPPSNYNGGKCPKCGKSVSKRELVSFTIPGAHGYEDYDYHKLCVINALNNALDQQIRRRIKSNPVKIPFKGSKRIFNALKRPNKNGCQKA